MLGGHPGASMLDDLLTLGRLSCIGTTFLDLDNTMDKLEIIQFLVHHQLLPLPKGRLEHCGRTVFFFTHVDILMVN